MASFRCRARGVSHYRIARKTGNSIFIDTPDGELQLDRVALERTGQVKRLGRLFCLAHPGLLANWSSDGYRRRARHGKPTIYTFTGVVSVTDSTGVESRYVRELMFVVNHHEHFRDDTTDVWVENARRPKDTFDFRAHQRQGLAGVLGEIHDYMSEQERRASEDGDTIAQRVARIRARATEDISTGAPKA